jgi:hypothetical protein
VHVGLSIGPDAAVTLRMTAIEEIDGSMWVGFCRPRAALNRNRSRQLHRPVESAADFGHSTLWRRSLTIAGLFHSNS